MLDLKSSYKQLLHNCKVYFIFTAIAKADGSHLQDTKWILSVILERYLLLMNFNDYDVKLGSWYQGLVQYVMERKA